MLDNKSLTGEEEAERARDCAGFKPLNRMRTHAAMNHTPERERDFVVDTFLPTKVYASFVPTIRNSNQPLCFRKQK